MLRRRGVLVRLGGSDGQVTGVAERRLAYKSIVGMSEGAFERVHHE